MILPTACINWALLRSGKGLGEFLSSLTPEKEDEILISYNAWRRSKGLPEEKAIEASPPPAPRNKTAPRAASNNDISTLINKVAAEMEQEEEAEEALIQEALSGADELAEGKIAMLSEVSATEAGEESEAASDAAVLALVTEMFAIEAGEESAAASDAAEPALITEESAIEAGEESAASEAAEPVLITEESAIEAGEESAAASEATEPTVDDLMASLPKESDPILYNQIIKQMGAEAAREKAEERRRFLTSKHRGTMAVRAFIQYLEGVDTHDKA